MPDLQTNESLTLIDMGSQAGVKKAGEQFASRALNWLVDSVKKSYSTAQVHLGTAFSRYLENATQRYNQVKTLATGTVPRTIIGEGSIYVSIGVSHQGNEVDTHTVDPMLKISNNILVLGTGGIGKSMMMRYLFLNTAYIGEYIPVLLELRKISNQAADHISILDLIYSCMKDFDVQLPKDQFEYSLRLGKYLFLMDGFDEVKETHALATADAIQKFCAKYPKNPCIITSRHRGEITPLETFTTVESMTLSKGQAVVLASKIWKEDEKTREFCRQLNDELYEKHQDFAENPLLLSMMFLTFMRNTSIPDHLAEFYSKAYEALYNKHDSVDKGYYCREFKCKDLDETGFKRILSHFCFQSYFKEDYEFTQDELLGYLKKSIKKFGYTICENDYLEDLRNAICIIVKDGDIYRFAHRSFQTYFAACYTSEVLTDEQQKKLFESILITDFYGMRKDYYTLLWQIEPQRLAENALEKPLRKVCSEADNQPNPDLYFLRRAYSGIGVDTLIENRVLFAVSSTNYHYKNFNHIQLFLKLVKKNYFAPEEDTSWKYIRSCVGLMRPEKEAHPLYYIVPFNEIDSSDLLSEDERDKLYEALVRVSPCAKIHENVSEWLIELEKKRALLNSDNFIDEL